MKKILLFLIILTISSLLSQAQEKLWGVTPKGTANTSNITGGVIFTTDTDGANYEVQYELRRYPGSFPTATKLAIDGDGNLIGVAGTAIFKYNPITGDYIAREPLGGSGTDPRTPGGGATISSGIIYGVTANGGANFEGTIYRLNFDFNNFEIEYDFSLSTGEFPTANLLAVGTTFYGVTRQGGVNDEGVLYSFNRSTDIYTKLVDFNSVTTGNNPIGELLLEDNKLYGVTSVTNGGTIFAYDLINDNLITVLDNLVSSTTGAKPGGGLMKASDGLLYGVMENGGSESGGLIYSIDPATNTQTIIHEFDRFPGTFGYFPHGTLLEGSDGKLYGMAQGGANSFGVVYSYDLATDTYEVEIDFNDDNGYVLGSDWNSLVEASNGKIYGMTRNGGLKNDGVLFSLDPTSGISKVELDLGRSDGNKPEGNLIKASNGKLYGTALQGGEEAEGTLFEYDITNEEYRVLHEFGAGSDGKFPSGNITQGSDGLLYGTTQENFSTGQGTIYSYNLETDEYLVRAQMGQFTANTDLVNPHSGLIEYTPGEFYGITFTGTAIFSYNSTTDVLTTEKTLSPLTEGEKPTGDLLLASNNKFYGLTREGGANNDGTLFSFDPATDIFTVLHTFDKTVDGGGPEATLIQASDGKLYGTADTTTTDGGIIFSYDITNDLFAVEHSHSDDDLGSDFNGTLTQLSDGTLVGMTEQGGVNGNGTIFEFDIDTKAYAVISEFNNTGGRMPKHTQLLFVKTPNVWNGSAWSFGTSPLPEDDVMIEGDFTALNDGAFNSDNLSILTGATLTINNERGITVNGDLTNNGSLIIESGSSLITFASENYSGNDLTIKRTNTHSDGKYNFVGSPVQQDASITGSDIGSIVYKYNEAIPYGTNDGLNRWLNANSDELKPGVGYAQANKGALAFEGIPNIGTVTVSGTYTEDLNDANEGWNLVSNPYTAPIRISNFISGNMNILGSLYFWDDNNTPGTRGSNSDYVVVNSIGIVQNSDAMSFTEFNAFVSTSQGFFVKLLNSTNTDIVFTESMRHIGELNNSTFFREEPPETIRLNLTNNDGLIRQTLVGIVSETSEQSLNRLYDAPMINQEKPEAFYSVKLGTALSIQGIESGWSSIPLGMNISTTGEYEISLVSEANSAIYLMDIETGVLTDLSIEAYEFVAKNGVSTSRFELVNKPSQILNVKEVTDRIFAYNNQLHIERNSEDPKVFRIYSLTGNSIMEVKVKGSEIINMNNIQPGIYLVSDGLQTEKILIK